MEFAYESNRTLRLPAGEGLSIPDEPRDRTKSGPTAGGQLTHPWFYGVTTTAELSREHVHRAEDASIDERECRYMETSIGIVTTAL